MGVSFRAFATDTSTRCGEASSSARPRSSAHDRSPRSWIACAAYAEANPELEWIEGGGYDPSLLPAGIGDAAALDAAVRDRPVVLEASDHHTMWVNSEALRRAGIDAATPDPPLGRILRRGDGSPIGTLVEWDALAMMRRHIPPATARGASGGARPRDARAGTRRHHVGARGFRDPRRRRRLCGRGALGWPHIEGQHRAPRRALAVEA